MKDPKYAMSPEGQQHAAFVNALDTDATGEKVLGRYFGQTVKGMKMEEEAARKKNEWVKVIGPDGKPTLVPASANLTGLTPYVETKPVRPASVAPGASLVDPGTGKVIYTAPDKPVMTEREAIDKQSQILSSLTRIGKGSAIDALVATLDPSLSGLIGANDPESIAAAKEALTKQLGYVQGFIPEKMRTKLPEAKKITPSAEAKKDQFGYTVGQTAEKDGKKYKYIGNDQWQRL
jgi:hypothetical protein